MQTVATADIDCSKTLSNNEIKKEEKKKPHPVIKQK